MIGLMNQMKDAVKLKDCFLSRKYRLKYVIINLIYRLFIEEVLNSDFEFKKNQREK